MDNDITKDPNFVDPFPVKPTKVHPGLTNLMFRRKDPDDDRWDDRDYEYKPEREVLYDDQG